MKPIDISINHAKLTGFVVELNDDKPEISATIALLAPSGKKVATYSLSTNAYNRDIRFDLPFDIVPPIKDVADVLERIITLHCQGTMMQLPPAAEEVQS
jgi:hypothetical protein